MASVYASAPPLEDDSSPFFVTSPSQRIYPVFAPNERRPDPTEQTLSEAAAVLEVPDRPPDAVYVAFFRHGTYSPFVRPWQWLVSRRLRQISKKYEHCQFVFLWYYKDREPSTATFSTNKAVPSSYVNPAYTADNWDVLPVVSAGGDAAVRTRTRLWNWCAEHQNAPFNSFGYYWNHLPPASCCSCLAYNARGAAFYCAEQISSALHDLDLAEARDLSVPYRCVPDDIYHVLKSHGARPTTLSRPSSVTYAPTGDPSNLASSSSVASSNPGDCDCHYCCCCCFSRCCCLSGCCSKRNKERWDDEGSCTCCTTSCLKDRCMSMLWDCCVPYE